MKVSEVGEFGLINLLAEMVNGSPVVQKAFREGLITGIGDDAAVWAGESGLQLATIDSFIQDIHFSLSIGSWEDLGWRVMAANLSDIAAMGGQPRYALVSLALPSDTEINDVTALYRGMLALAEPVGVAIAGGDTDRAPLVTVTITVLGSAITGRHVLTRSAARPGDRIAVTGHLGAAAAGLEMMTRGLQLPPEDTGNLAKAFLRPSPRLAEGQLLVEHGVETAIDISDGLLADLGHICRASRVSACIESDNIPVAPAVKANFPDSLEKALAGGEDFELLFTGSKEAIDSVKRAAACPITIIGEIVPGETGDVTLVDKEGRPVSLGKTGWEHFKTA